LREGFSSYIYLAPDYTIFFYYAIVIWNVFNLFMVRDRELSAQVKEKAKIGEQESLVKES